MTWFGRQPLARKLTLQAVAISVVAILLIGFAGIGYEQIIFRKTVLTDLAVQADIIGDNCAAALEFENPLTATETLSSLRARADISAACVYGVTGNEFAQYRSPSLPTGFRFPAVQVGDQFAGSQLLLFRPIIRKNERLGTVFVLADLAPHYARMFSRILVSVIAILCAAVIALALAIRLQRVISHPILHLASVAEQIRTRHDFSLRARAGGSDEVGALAEGFNRMLEDIQQRDQQLHRAYAAIQESEERFRQLAESIREVFWLTDPTRSAVLYVSPVYEQVWGRTCQSLYDVPRSWMEAIHPADRAAVQKAILKQDSGLYDVEYRIVRPDGNLRWIRDRAWPIRDAAGKMFRLAGIAEDITEKHHHQQTLRRLSTQILRAQDEERRRIASELHDVTVQNLIGTGFSLSSLRNSAAGLSATERQTLDEAVQSLKDCATEVRTLSYLVHPPFLDKLGLGAALHWYVEGFSQRTGIQVQLKNDPELRRFSKDVELAVYRVLQEALTNVHRHSGSLVAKISLVHQDHHLILEVNDIGRGIKSGNATQNAEAPFGVGLTAMRERVEQLGGQFQVLSGPTGTTIRAVLPVNEEISPAAHS